MDLDLFGSPMHNYKEQNLTVMYSLYSLSVSCGSWIFLMHVVFASRKICW